MREKLTGLVKGLGKKTRKKLNKKRLTNLFHLFKFLNNDAKSVELVKMQNIHNQV